MICRVTWSWIVGVSPYTGLPKTLVWRNARTGELGLRGGAVAGVVGPPAGMTPTLPIGTEVERVVWGGRSIYTVGKPQVIQTKNPRFGGVTVARRTVLCIRLLDPRAISGDDLLHSGYQTATHFLTTYAELYPGQEAHAAWAITLAGETDGEEMGESRTGQPA